MKLPFPLIPESKQDMYYFIYGAAVMTIVSMFMIVNLVWNVNSGMEARVMDVLQNSTIVVNYGVN